MRKRDFQVVIIVMVLFLCRNRKIPQLEIVLKQRKTRSPKKLRQNLIDKSGAIMNLNNISVAIGPFHRPSRVGMVY